MVRLIAFLLLLHVTSSANILHYKIERFLGSAKYQTSKNLINMIFKNQNAFLLGEQKVNDIKVIKTLKRNGVMKLIYDKPRNISLKFEMQNRNLVFVHVINDILNSMGYNYYLTNTASKKDGLFSWELSLQSEQVVDPIELTNKLKENGALINDIDCSRLHHWNYKLDTSDLRLHVKEAKIDREMKLTKPIKPYWLSINEAKKISIQTNISDRWYPNITFFDKELGMVQNIKKDDAQREKLVIEVPQNAYYIKLDDIYSLDNIKRGLLLYTE